MVHFWCFSSSCLFQHVALTLDMNINCCNKVCSHCVGGADDTLLGFQLYISIDLCTSQCTHLQLYLCAIPTKLQNVALALDMN
jgi:hypothetical protein